MPSTSTRCHTEKIAVTALSLLSSSATDKERIAYIKRHVESMTACGRRSLQHAWLVGRELIYTKEKQPDLSGYEWHKFVQRHFTIGERGEFDLMRLHRSFRTLRSIPQGVETVSGAIAALRVKREVEDAEASTGRKPSSSRKDSSSGERHPRSKAEAAPVNHPTATVHAPSVALSASPQVRMQLIAMQQELREIANKDMAAFRKVRAIVRESHARVCRASTRKSSKVRRAG